MEYLFIENEKDYNHYVNNEHFIEWCWRMTIVIQNRLSELIDITNKYPSGFSVSTKRTDECNQIAYANKGRLLVSLQQEAYKGHDICSAFCAKLKGDNKPPFEEFIRFKAEVKKIDRYRWW